MPLKNLEKAFKSFKAFYKNLTLFEGLLKAF